jgi:hypothetical protein
MQKVVFFHGFPEREQLSNPASDKIRAMRNCFEYGCSDSRNLPQC